jgi:hypothetical protein
MVEPLKVPQKMVTNMNVKIIVIIYHHAKFELERKKNREKKVTETSYFFNFLLGVLPCVGSTLERKPTVALQLLPKSKIFILTPLYSIYGSTHIFMYF